MVMCVAKTLIERLGKEGRRLEGWVSNSFRNHVRMALYEGDDSYVDFSSKGNIVTKMLHDLQNNSLDVHGRHYDI